MTRQTVRFPFIDVPQHRFQLVQQHINLLNQNQGGTFEGSRGPVILYK